MRLLRPMRDHGRIRVFLVIVCGLACAWPAAALADSATIPNDGSLPWTDPNHQHPLEVLAGRIASTIAGRPVGVRCEGANDWQKLSRENGSDSDGFVRATWYWGGSTWSPVTEDFAQLSPRVCESLQRFAAATSKPTKCAPIVTHTETVLRRVKVVKKVRKKVHGKWVIRSVKSTKLVPKQVTTQVEGPLGPCYLDGGREAAKMPASFWKDYAAFSEALLVLAHEAAHLGGDLGVVVPEGYPGAGQAGYADAEARAQCHGVQWMPYVAEQLGDTRDDGRALAGYFFDVLYPKIAAQYPQYGSADCHENGALDLSPGDGVWP